jgi:hypothetical protein
MFNSSIKGSPLDRPPYIRKTAHIQSFGEPTGSATKPVTAMKYTGTEMLGVGVLHKSNGVPVFDKETILEISRMRRG